ncbi:MAG: rRNA adenine N-6-methyltransferase family protein, partial [Acidimicrobiaceae bacterium]
MTHSGADIRALLDRHGLEARRSFGQNFVVDPNTVRRIAALAEVGPGDPIVEIGPGLGSLTLALLEHDASVTAVEMDAELVPILREIVAGRDVTIIEGDAQQVDWDALLAAHPAWKLVANLPYNVATPLILDLLRDVPAITEMLVMVQLEVAERLA